MRFDRRYRLTVGVGDKAAVITAPLRIAFKVDKNAGSGGLNSANIQIYNLKADTRGQLLKSKEETRQIPVELAVGYGEDVAVIFKGTVFEGTLQRQGPDFINLLQCLDGGDTIFSFTSKSVRGKAAVYTAATDDMEFTTQGKITEQPKLTRPKVLVGNSLQVITDNLAPGEEWFIDDQKLNIVKKGEVLSSYIPIVSAATGLRNTPKLEAMRIVFDTMMNPTLKLGCLCKVESVTAEKLNGIYKIDQMTYAGDLDGNEWGQVVTGFLTPEYKVI